MTKLVVQFAQSLELSYENTQRQNKTYKEIASIKKPPSYRAVANAVLKIPIHRSFFVTGLIDQMVPGAILRRCLRKKKLLLKKKSNLQNY